MQTRLRPGFLDLLFDDRAGNIRDGDYATSFTLSQFKAGILRELSWLFNASRLDLTEDLGSYPEVSRSALNYGMRSLTGSTDSARTKTVLRNEILMCLRRFEPRLLPENLQVTAVQDANGETYHFRIEGEFWAEPQPLHMLMRTQVGSTGEIRVIDLRGEG